jgi:hypothetical protein
MCTQQAPAAGASVAAASTADSSGLGGLTAGLQKQIDSGAATLTTNISTQLETLTDKVSSCSFSAQHPEVSQLLRRILGGDAALSIFLRRWSLLCTRAHSAGTDGTAINRQRCALFQLA